MAYVGQTEVNEMPGSLEVSLNDWYWMMGWWLVEFWRDGEIEIFGE